MSILVSYVGILYISTIVMDTSVGRVHEFSITRTEQYILLHTTNDEITDEIKNDYDKVNEITNDTLQ